MPSSPTWTTRRPISTWRPAWPPSRKAAEDPSRARARRLASSRPGSARQLLVADPVRLIGRHAELPVAVLLVLGEVALEPADDAVALERQDVGGDPVEEPAV